MSYKPEQGRIARTSAFWALAFLVVYGCTSLDDALEQYFGRSGESWLFAKWIGSTIVEGQQVGGLFVPILSWKLTPALIVAVVACGLGLWLLNRYLNRPKVAELLIETENELRKVTWPTMNEAVTSSLVVIVCVMFLMVYLATADWWLGRVVTWVLLGSGS
jgi:preprotein translocase SecE subunit